MIEPTLQDEAYDRGFDEGFDDGAEGRTFRVRTYSADTHEQACYQAGYIKGYDNGSDLYDDEPTHWADDPEFKADMIVGD